MDFDRFKKINDEKPNCREIENADVDFKFNNEACGDGYRIFLRIKDGVVEDASYTTSGCGFGLASLEFVTALAKGKTLDQAAGITAADIEGEFEFPERRKNYPPLAAEVMRLAVESYKEKTT